MTVGHELRGWVVQWGDVRPDIGVRMAHAGCQVGEGCGVYIRHAEANAAGVEDSRQHLGRVGSGWGPAAVYPAHGRDGRSGLFLRLPLRPAPASRFPVGFERLHAWVREGVETGIYRGLSGEWVGWRRVGDVQTAGTLVGVAVVPAPAFGGSRPYIARADATDDLPVPALVERCEWGQGSLALPASEADGAALLATVGVMRAGVEACGVATLVGPQLNADGRLSYWLQSAGRWAPAFALPTLEARGVRRYFDADYAAAADKRREANAEAARLAARVEEHRRVELSALSGAPPGREFMCN